MNKTKGLNFEFMNSLQSWVHEQEVAVNKKMSWVSMGFKKKKMNKKNEE